MEDRIKTLSYFGLGVACTIAGCLVQLLLRLTVTPTPLPHVIGITAIAIGVLGYTRYRDRSPLWLQLGLMSFGVSILLAWHEVYQ